MSDNLTIEFDGWYVGPSDLGGYSYRHDSHDSDNWMAGNCDTLEQCIEEIIEHYYQCKKEGK